MLNKIDNLLTLQLIEIFSSIQGETSLAGLPTTFVRLAACNLRCTWCDTSYSFGRGATWSLEHIVQEVQKRNHSYVCVTGGEPLLQNNVHPLMNQLCDQGYQLSLETGGSLSIGSVDRRVLIVLDIKCPNSGMSHRNEWSNIPLLKPSDEVKFVLASREDYEYAKNICITHHLFQRACPILFSPVHGVLDPKELVQWVLSDQLPIRLNLQLHKYIWGPLTQGV